MGMNNAAKIIGTSEEVTTCECCGRSNLKRTVVLDIEGAVRYFGCDCAARTYRSSSVRNLNGQDMKKLGEWANMAKRYGTDRVIARHGNRNLELVGAA